MAEEINRELLVLYDLLKNVSFRTITCQHHPIRWQIRMVAQKIQCFEQQVVSFDRVVPTKTSDPDNISLFSRRRF